MNISDPRRPWIPACATNIRATFARVDPSDDWKSRLEGAREVMRKLAAETEKPSNVTALKPRRA